MKEDAELDRAFREIFSDLQAYGLIASTSARTPMGRQPRYSLAEKGVALFAYRRRQKMVSRVAEPAEPRKLQGVEWVNDRSHPTSNFPEIDVDE